MMMVLLDYAYQRILEYHFAGCSPPDIEKLMYREQIKITRVGIWEFLKKYNSTGTIARRKGGGRRSALTPAVRLIVEQQMVRDDETTVQSIYNFTHACYFQRGTTQLLPWQD